MLRAIFACTALLAFGGCSAPAKESAYPPRPAGCDVKIYPEAPQGNTDNIGPVSAKCDESVSDADCLRTLQDEACKLGADVLWGVEPPEKRDGKKRFFGRAAHTSAKPR